MQAPTIRDVYRDRRTIAPYFQRTPLHYSMGLSELLDAEVYIKHEEYLPLGAFKSRGGINLLSNLSDGGKAKRAHHFFHRQSRAVHSQCRARDSVCG